MEHGVNTEKERNSYGFGKRGDHGEDTKALSLATRSFTWKVSFGNPCPVWPLASKVRDRFHRNVEEVHPTYCRRLSGVNTLIAHWVWVGSRESVAGLSGSGRADR